MPEREKIERNETLIGDAVFDGTLREGLSVELEQSTFLSLVSEEGIHQTLRMMGQMTDARLTAEIAREVCQRTNSAVALDGSIALIGTRYNLILKAVDCATGDSLVSTEAQADDKSHVLDALGEIRQITGNSDRPEKGKRRSVTSQAPPLLRQRKPYLTGSPPSRQERRCRQECRMVRV